MFLIAIMSHNITVVVLAAGHSKRLKRSHSKLWLPLGGIPVIEHVLNMARTMGTVYGVYGESTLALPERYPWVTWCLQTPAMGTGHALQCALPYLPKTGTLLVLLGDCPVLQQDALQSLTLAAQTHLALLVADTHHPKQLGRVSHQNGCFTAIVEWQPHHPNTYCTVFSGVMAMPLTLAHYHLPTLQTTSSECYMTDLPNRLVHQVVLQWGEADLLQSVNHLSEWATLERWLQRQHAERFMQQGVWLDDPNRFDVRGTLQCGHDVHIGIGVIFIGTVILGNNVSIEHYCILQDTTLADHVRIEAFSHLNGACIGAHSVIGPFARIRPTTQCGEYTKVGNFVELKETTLMDHVRIAHLAYVGNAKVDHHALLGAGVVTANYDGHAKHATHIAHHATIGANSTLIAPLHVAPNATIAAGTTVPANTSIPDNTLIIARPSITHHPKKPVYVAKNPDSQGYVAYTANENDVWKILYERQIKLLKNRACQEFIKGVHCLNVTADRIPQLPDVSKRLYHLTGWSVTPVKALISFKEFFTLLSLRQFPVATFIRLPEHLDYLQEPDIFHEIFGHCPLLTNPAFADFTQHVGNISQHLTPKEIPLLARLYWFTVEFGLIRTPEGLRIYGGGILSSKGESIYALESDTPKRHHFDLLTVLSTTYRYDQMQKNYFIIDSFNSLFALVQHDLRPLFKKVKDVITSEDVRSC
jgi:phenylalanine-4-hydroxylase